jgi:hypothetical protein
MVPISPKCTFTQIHKRGFVRRPRPGQAVAGLFALIWLTNTSTVAMVVMLF